MRKKTVDNVDILVLSFLFTIPYHLFTAKPCRLFTEKRLSAVLFSSTLLDAEWSDLVTDPGKTGERWVGGTWIPAYS